MQALLLSILMLAGFALAGGGIFLLTKKRNRKQAWLMLVAAAVMFGNVAIWSIPLE